MNKEELWKAVLMNETKLLFEISEAYKIKKGEILDYLLNQDITKENIDDNALHGILFEKYPYKTEINVWIQMTSGIDYDGFLQTGDEYMNLGDVLKRDTIVIIANGEFIEINTKMIECYKCCMPRYTPTK